jgi:hypothetical protein
VRVGGLVVGDPADDAPGSGEDPEELGDPRARGGEAGARGGLDLVGAREEQRGVAAEALEGRREVAGGEQALAEGGDLAVEAVDLSEADRVDLGGVQVEGGVLADLGAVAGEAVGEVHDAAPLGGARARQELGADELGEVDEGGAELELDGGAELRAQPGERLRGPRPKGLAGGEGREQRPGVERLGELGVEHPEDATGGLRGGDAAAGEATGEVLALGRDGGRDLADTGEVGAGVGEALDGVHLGQVVPLADRVPGGREQPLVESTHLALDGDLELGAEDCERGPVARGEGRGVEGPGVTEEGAARGGFLVEAGPGEVAEAVVVRVDAEAGGFERGALEAVGPVAAEQGAQRGVVDADLRVVEGGGEEVFVRRGRGRRGALVGSGGRWLGARDAGEDEGEEQAGRAWHGGDISRSEASRPTHVPGGPEPSRAVRLYRRSVRRVTGDACSRGPHSPRSGTP